MTLRILETTSDLKRWHLCPPGFATLTANPKLTQIKTTTPDRIWEETEVTEPSWYSFLTPHARLIMQDEETCMLNAYQVYEVQNCLTCIC